MGITKDNQSGANQATWSEDFTDYTTVVTGEAVTSRDIPGGSPESIPPPVVGQINYFGSSYSGADIKVYANLYNSADSLVAIIDRDKQIYSLIRSACEQLLANMNSIAANFGDTLGIFEGTNKPQRDIFLDGIGLGDPSSVEEQLAAKEMIDDFYLFLLEAARNNQNFSILRTEVQKKSSLAQTMITTYNNEAKNLKDNIFSSSLFHLGTLQTLSVQSHREKYAVRALGHSHVKGFTRGPRTIAGSMIFTVFHEHSFASLMRRMAAVEKDPEITSFLPDQLPPLDLVIVFANEYGQNSEFRIYGLEILNDGVTYSIEDLLTENVMQFVCRDVDPLTDKGRVSLDRTNRNNQYESTGVRGSSLYESNKSYLEYMDRLKVRRRLVSR